MKVILYTIHCPKCNILEKKLDMAGISYGIVDDEDAVIQFGREHNKCYAPLLVVDDQVMDFDQARAWLSEQGK